MSMQCAPFRKTLLTALISGASIFTAACADVNVPDPRNVNIPAPVTADERRQAVNERPDSVMYLPLGEDILVPETLYGGSLPSEKVGPFELRGETLAGALQLILADYDVSLAFETEEGLSRQITVANLKGDLDKVVDRVCSLADLYCSYEDGTVVVKDTQIFTVTLPPIGDDSDDTSFIDDVIAGLEAIVGEDVDAPVSDPTTRSIIYTATQRSAKLAENYFQRLRANTALVVFETYIWEVSLDADNTAGINWQDFTTIGKYNIGASLSGSAVGATNPVSIGLPTTGFIGEGTDPTEVFNFLSTFGAVKTISQPQISVLSGSSAELRVADTENYVSEIVTTLTDSGSTTAVTTDSVESGFTLAIASSWDKSTVYADIDIELENVNSITPFTFSDGGAAGTSTQIQLPDTSERELTTQVRIRPGDSLLIGGLVRENDSFNSRGAGLMEPLIPDSRSAGADNLELVFMMRPRVVVYTSGADQRYKNYMDMKNAEQSALQSAAREDWMKSGEVNPYKTVREKPVESVALPVESGMEAKGEVVKDVPSVSEPVEKQVAPVELTPPAPEPVPVPEPESLSESVELTTTPEVVEPILEKQEEVAPEPEQEALQPLSEPAMSDEMSDIIDGVTDAEEKAVKAIEENLVEGLVVEEEPVQAVMEASSQEGLEMFPVDQDYGEPEVELIEAVDTEVYDVPEYEALNVEVTENPTSVEGRVSKSVNDFSEQYVPSDFEGRVSKTVDGQ